MQKCTLAVDIGASSGRVIAGFLKDGNLILEEVHRFKNEMKQGESHLYWDVDLLFQEIVSGIKKCNTLKFLPQSIGIETWAVDFVLLDKNKKRITDAVAYRDNRTDGMMEEVLRHIKKEELYERTGIQYQKFNTIYQLYSMKLHEKKVLDEAKYFLMIPDYLHYRLSGELVNEYTNATSTQLVKADERQWDEELITRLDLNPSMFLPITEPCVTIGRLTESLKKELGFDMEVIAPGTHDTASAVVSVPAEDSIYISSGTWSLMGVENDQAINSEEALLYNFTNEGGVGGNFRFLKNIMGLWMIQEVKRLLNDSHSHEELVELAKGATIPSIVNVNDDRFLSPKNMIEEIKVSCKETNQVIPETPGELAKVIFDSLVKSYHETINQIERLSNKKYESINIIGGGSQNAYIKISRCFTKRCLYRANRSNSNWQPSCSVHGERKYFHQARS